MRHKQSLYNRIALSYVLLALLLASFFSVVAYQGVEVGEEYLIANRLESTAAKLVANALRGETLDPPPGISFYADGAIPAVLRVLPDGVHETDVEDDSVFVKLLTKSGRRFAVIDHQEDFERAEQKILATVAAGFAASLLLSMLVGLSIARRVIHPVTALASAIRQDAPVLPSLDAQDEMGILARAFAGRTEELQQFLDRERLFTGDVSHELRTPLTVILGASEVLIAQLRDRPALLAVAERIRRAAVDTAERTSALLILSRAPETLDAPRTELRALIEREMARCQPLLLGKSIECRFEAPSEVWAHAQPELVGIALGNLLANAYQYCDAGTVRVALDAGRLAVEDSGAGVPDNVRERLFERFVRGSNDGQSGTGLGLAIVKRVVDHLGWKIDLENRAEGGTRFVLLFPTA